jgi:hypothetical protein
MNRRNYLKSVGSTTLLPTISVPDFLNGDIPYRYLERLFSDYTIEQFEESCHGECFSADWYTDIDTEDYYLIQYRVFENHDSIFTVQYYDKDGNPKNIRVDGLRHKKAHEFAEIGRRQGCESLLSVLDELEEERSFRYSKFVTTYIIDGEKTEIE